MPRPHSTTTAPAAALIACGALAAGCGAEPLAWEQAESPGGQVQAAVVDPSDKRYTPADVMAWDGCDTLGANKRALVDAATRAGANDEQTRIFLAMGMGETNMMNACDRDLTKDRRDAAGQLVPVCQNLERNMSAFNMNCDMLSQLGWQEGQGPDLNDQAQIDTVVKYLLAGVHKFGMDGFLSFHRGGSTALADGRSYGAEEYRSGIYAVAQRLADNRADMTNNRRLGLAIKHV